MLRALLFHQSPIIAIKTQGGQQGDMLHVPFFHYKQRIAIKHDVHWVHCVVLFRLLIWVIPFLPDCHIFT